ncbi:WG repeat-containing protein [Robertkochia marina]|uniref:WG repeat-containing protein n=1 Tax=Robertkochia marina TaxID=1227945 RepID=A0A4S3M1Y3_9FLAO|nr:WG repeat-containing protein [Robertkochia marina]THD67579.1 WG repeat-containing protein [Robertkochia marina]TRZ44553.1 WG repeat-containing protein [Robertkochia marina]
MKKLLLFLLSGVFTLILSAQEHSGLAAVGELSDGLISVEKDGKWAFIDQEGALVIDYRDDLVTGEKAPEFKEGRCLIQQTKEGIPYYGYIDTSGEIVIEPIYLNATAFKDGYAIVLKMEEQVRGTNQYLNKEIIDRNFDEVLINTQGDELKYLTAHKGVLLDAKKYKQPEMVSKIVSSGLVAFKDESGKWKVAKL